MRKGPIYSFREFQELTYEQFKKDSKEKNFCFLNILKWHSNIWEWSVQIFSIKLGYSSSDDFCDTPQRLWIRCVNKER